MFGVELAHKGLLPLAAMPAGGFLVLGVVAAIWRALAKKRKTYLKAEAQAVMAVHRQKKKEADAE